MAPVTPLVTEVMYRNLVRGMDSSAPESVHHCDWPVADKTARDQDLIMQMDLTRRIASLGLSARESAQLKVRQPLARALVHTGDSTSLSDELTAIVQDELNVKALEFVKEAGDLVAYKLLPNLKLLGPKLGKLVPAVRMALIEADAAALVSRIEAGESVTISVEGQELELVEDEILVQTEPAAGLAIAADRLITVGVDTVINDELAAEGMARELVRRIQNMRKDANFDISDRITIYHQAEGFVLRVFRQWADYIKAETLAVAIEHQLIPEVAFQRKERVDGEDVMLGVKRVN
jgi:isoleucyl-tRNA synthetase